MNNIDFLSNVLKDDGILYVPILDKKFDRLGRLVK